MYEDYSHTLGAHVNFRGVTLQASTQLRDPLLKNLGFAPVNYTSHCINIWQPGQIMHLKLDSQVSH